MKLKKKTIKRLSDTYGKKILITGATSGIGKEMALKFGEAGFSLILTGRREHLLNELSTFLSETYMTEVQTVCGDLSTESGIHDLLKQTEKSEIGIAVLNAGFGTSGKFIDSNLEQEIGMLNLNCKALAVLTHQFSGRMRKQKQRGAIVLLSSMVAFQGVPNAAHYAATKAYVQSLGEALALELKAEGIDILCAAPGPVETGFSKRADMKMSMALKPEHVGVPIIRAIGKKTNVLPGFLTKLLVYSLKTAPRWAKVRIMGTVMKGFTKHQAG